MRMEAPCVSRMKAVWTVCQCVMVDYDTNCFEYLEMIELYFSYSPIPSTSTVVGASVYVSICPHGAKRVFWGQYDIKPRFSTWCMSDPFCSLLVKSTVLPYDAMTVSMMTVLLYHATTLQVRKLSVWSDRALVSMWSLSLSKDKSLIQDTIEHAQKG
jgi:hypothetical protein